jgi:hypothetical protein
MPGDTSNLTTDNPPAPEVESELARMPRQELEHLAEELGLDFTRYPSRELLVDAVEKRRQLIATLDRNTMLELVRWGRRPVAANATHEQLGHEIARIRLMRFTGLSREALIVLAHLRGVEFSEDDNDRAIVRKLRRQEGIVERFNRKKRAFLGSLVSSIVGDAGEHADYQFLTPADSPTAKTSPPGQVQRTTTLKDEIEESGLLGGLTSRIKKTADQYLNQKLDEVEKRIDRKLDEIDRRLSEWRDKEIANRIKILKITLWASVIVGVVSLIYAWVKVYLVSW